MKNFVGPLHGKRQTKFPQGEVKDTIIPCPTCGTYNPSKEAYVYQGKCYCNQKCFENSLRVTKN